MRSGHCARSALQDSVPPAVRCDLFFAGMMSDSAASSCKLAHGEIGDSESQPGQAGALVSLSLFVPPHPPSCSATAGMAHGFRNALQRGESAPTKMAPSTSPQQATGLPILSTVILTLTMALILTLTKINPCMRTSWSTRHEVSDQGKQEMISCKMLTRDRDE